MSSGSELADAKARDRIQNDLRATLVVEAAAGTGKTTALVGRILSLLVRGETTLARIIAVTFTEKAAGEMKLRLRSEIERVRQAKETGPEERKRLDAALSELEEARMSTIHGFCADILRERAVEAGVDPMFEVADDVGGLRLFREAFDPWFTQILNAKSEGVQRLLRRRPRGRFMHGPRRELLRAGMNLADIRDFDGAWTRPVFDRKKEIDEAVAKLKIVGALYAKAGDKRSFLAQNLEAISRFSDELERREDVSGSRDYDGLEPLLAELLNQRSWNWKGGPSWFAPQIPKAAVLTQRDEARIFVQQVLARCEADLAASLREELRPVIEAYEREKARAGKLDFFDLLLRTRDLLVSSDIVRNELQDRYTHVLVDEFQDTDPLQAEIVLLLAADDPTIAVARKARPKPGKLFIVGDPKQSIYRFRRADVALYETIKEQLCDQGAELLHLTTSFRAVPALQKFINDAFSDAMRADEKKSQASYVKLEPYRKEIGGQPTVVALPVPRPYSPLSGRVSAWRVSESTPDAVAAFVDWMLKKSNWMVSERDNPKVPIESRHVCLLFKRFQMMGEDVTRPYARALEARRIPHVLLGGRSFHEREEVQALRATLAAIEWPDDELSVYATLRGPLLAIGDDALLVWRSRFKSLHPMRPAPALEELDDLTRPVFTGLQLLKKLHMGRNRRPIADTIAQLLEATRAHAGIAIWPTGEQALANVLRLMDMARRFEAEPATSFRAFVQMLEDDADEGEVAEAPVVEEGTEGVRMMTIHRAKGLEFSVVVLVDPAANPHPQRPSRYVDPDRKVWAIPLANCAPADLFMHEEEVLAADHAEAIRLLYVATTRARDILVVPAVADEVLVGKWLEPLYPVIYPRNSDRDRGERAPGCPPFTGDTTLERPGDVNAPPIYAGLHRSKVGDHPIVWWDPHALELDKQEEAGLRQQRILAADQGELFATEGERMYATWKSAHVKAVASGEAPTLRVQSVTEAAATGTATIPVALERTNAPRQNRPHGRRFGSFVHAVLATIPLDANEVAIATHAKTQARMFSASENEVQHAVAAAVAALAHPVLELARKSKDVRRECPGGFVTKNGDAIEGVLDLAFSEDAGWVIVDFKTDAEIEESRTKYERQVSLYAEAVSRATGKPARGVLLMV